LITCRYAAGSEVGALTPVLGSEILIWHFVEFYITHRLNQADVRSFQVHPFSGFPRLTGELQIPFVTLSFLISSQNIC
jgi:hypothetical protein